MRIFSAFLAAVIGCGVAGATIDTDAQIILDQGRWGLVTENLSAAAVDAARACTGSALGFAFTASEAQMIALENGRPDAAAPAIFAKVTRAGGEAMPVVSLFAAAADETPAVTFVYDADAKTLMRMGDDGDGTHLYALCRQ